jgi:ATP-dependent DNA ligase
LLRHRRNEPRAFLYVFDLLELNGTGLRREPIEVRKATLANTLRKSRRPCLDYSPSGSGHSTMSTCPQSMH